LIRICGLSDSLDDVLGTEFFQVGRHRATARDSHGFNLRESTFIARVLGLKEPAANSPLDVLAYSKELRERLRIDGVVIHWSRYAAGNDSDSAACVEAPFTDNPKISTGAGDHFPVLSTQRLIFLLWW
jgi:hypothetical protein